MPYSTCCGRHTTMPEYGICPDCKENCDWEDDEYSEPTDDQINNNYKTEGGISYSTPSWNGR